MWAGRNPKSNMDLLLIFEKFKWDFIKTFVLLSGMYVSMTSLLPHTVAQPTKWRFLPKNSSQLVIFVIGLAFTWV